MSIRVVDRDLELIGASSDTLSIGLTCSNRDVPLMLPFVASAAISTFPPTR
jgi:type VI secretion system protein ImpG